MSTTQAANDLLNGVSGPPAIKFPNVGAKFAGTITNMAVQQATDFKTKKPKFYDDGNPVMQVVISLRQDDGEEGRLFCKPAMARAIREAKEEAGVKDVEVGGRLGMERVADIPSDAGLDPQHDFRAQYKAPSNTVGESDLL